MDEWVGGKQVGWSMWSGMRNDGMGKDETCGCMGCVAGRVRGGEISIADVSPLLKADHSPLRSSQLLVDAALGSSAGCGAFQRRLQK